MDTKTEDIITSNNQESNINIVNKQTGSDDLNLRKKAKKRDRSPTSNDNTNTSKLIVSNMNSLQPSSPNSGVTPQITSINKKEKQRPETWNKIEQQIFFNALRQNGKNFESITQHFNARQKKYKVEDGVNVQRSKEQIRHFYYRTWHKVIKYVSLPMLKDCDGTSDPSNNKNNSVCLRDIQVKCLIAYNCLMNKSQRWNKKTSVKLIELINHGWTTVREKGKITRLRMPICKVSSKTISNDVDSNNQLPTTINIQLEPKTESAYCRVHRLAQNPFLTIEIPTLQSIKYLIEFLENKWKTRRNQFIERFQIDSKSQSENDDINGSNSKNDRLILYPNEIHQLSNLELVEASNQQNQINLESDQLEINTNNQTNTIEIQNFEDTEKSKKSNLVEDDIMMMDDCAIIPDSFPTNNPIQSKNNINNKKSNDNKIRFKLQADQLRSGLTASNTFLSSTSNIQPIASKELSIIQLYLALNKPNIIKLKYDWIIINKNSTNSELTNSGNANYYSSQNSQNQQQRFYIDTLASVALSFLNELNQKTIAQTASNTPSNSNNNINQVLKSTNNPIAIQGVAPSNKVIKSPPKLIPITNTSPLSEQSIAIIQPNSNGQSSTTTIVPVEAVLQRISEDQTNKTKILLSDLNTKRRSRTRKPIMVVNNGPIRNVLPKLTLSNGQFIKPINVDLNSSTNVNNNINIQSPHNVNSPSSNQSEQIQNIVVSGPIAAVARQIVNTNNLVSTQPLTTTTLIQANNINNNNNKVLIQSFHQYSNLIPQILNNLNENDNSNTSINNQVIIDGEPVRIKINNVDLNSKQNNENNMNPGSPQGLTNMSLLDLSINNNDSFFAAAAANAAASNASNNNNNDDATSNNNNLKEKISNDKDNNDSIGGFFTNIDINNLVKTKSMSNNNISEALQDNSSISSLSSILNSLNCNKSNQGSSISKLFGSSTSNYSINASNNNNINNSLVQKRSDILVEWTDSMNDVSLTGCFLNDLQSPEKSNKNGPLVHILNENSRDSIFFNMDTMDILLPAPHASNEAK